MNSQKSQKIFEAKTNAGVRQDKSAALGNREASEQGYRPPDEMRLNKEGTRSTPANGKRRSPGTSTEPLVPLTTQIPRSLKGEIQRLAKQEALSDSATAAAFLAKAIQGQIDLQYGALLRPVIEAAIKRELHSVTDRASRLAMNAFLAAEQSRVLIIHVLSLLLSGSTDVLPQLIKESQKQAWANLRNLMGEEGGEN